MDLTQIASKHENMTGDDIFLKALSDKKLDVVSFFLEGGYKPALNKKDETGSSIFHHLVQNSSNDIIKKYISKVISNKEVPAQTINLQNGGGDTGFHIAIRNGDHELAYLLEQSGASRIKNNNGEVPYTLNSPTHVATQKEPVNTKTEYLDDTIQQFDVEKFMTAFNNSQAGGNVNSSIHPPTKDDIFVKRSKVETPVSMNKINNNSTEQFVQKIINKLSTNSQPQTGGKHKKHHMPKLNREDIKKADIGLDSSEARHATNLYRNHVDELHQETIKQIKEVMNVDEIKARCYKAYLYKEVKNEHPELNGYDRATEMLKQVKKEVLKSVDIETLCAEIEKHLDENKKNKSKKVESISSSSPEQIKKPKKSKRKQDVSSDSSLLPN